MESWLTDEPFTKEQVNSFNYYSHYELDINKEFIKEIRQKEAEILPIIEKLGLKEVPEEVNKAFRDYRNSLYNYYLEYSRNRAYYPPASVVGTSKYPYHRKEKAMKQLDNITERLNNANKIFTNRIKPFQMQERQQKTQSLFEDFYNRWINKALTLKQTDFSKELAEALKAREFEKYKDTSYGKEIASGIWDHLYRKNANQQRKALLAEAERRGIYKPPPPEIKKTSTPSTKETYYDKYTKQLTEEAKEKPVYQRGVTEAYMLTKDEWYKALDSNYPDTMQTNFTRRSGAEAVAKMKEIERLHYDTAAHWDDIREGWIIHHGDIILKAISENKARIIPDKVKAEYPQYFSMPRQEARKLYADVYIDQMIATLIRKERTLEGSEKKRNEYINEIYKLRSNDTTNSFYDSLLKRIKERTGFELNFNTAPYDSMIDFVQYLSQGKHIYKYQQTSLFPQPEQLEFETKGEAKKWKPSYKMPMPVIAKKTSYKTPVQREFFKREQLELFGYNPLSSKTAITRKNLSVPARFLFDNGFLRGRVLDFGAGRGFDANFLKIEKYDPFFFPNIPRGEFDTVMSNYVLNVVSPEEVESVISEALSFVKPGGKAYFSVRRDITKEGKTSKGTEQYNVILPYKPILDTKKLTVYEIRR